MVWEEPDPEKIAADVRLVSSARSGQREARVRLGERLRCVPRILSALNLRRGKLLGQQDLEDLAQDVVVLVLRKLDRFTGQCLLESWVHRIAFYELMNTLRRRQRIQHELIESSGDHEAEELVAPAKADPVDYSFIEGHLAQISESAAAVIRLKHYDDMSFTDIGQILSLSPNTAKTRYYRAIAELERRLESYVQELER